MSYKLVLVERIYDADGKSGSHIVGTLADPELCKIALERLITRRETELHRLRQLGEKSSS